jgi:membrane protein YdbS with pleckstrin-like domain
VSAHPVPAAPAETGRQRPPAPERRLAPAARNLWRLEGALAGGFALLIGQRAARELDGLLGLLAWAGPLAGLVVAVAIVPELRWRRWRYAIRPEEIDIQRGTLAVVRTLVPMRRVQHVDSRLGVLERLFGLATVVFHTAAGQHEIPALEEHEAAAVRDRIAELTRTADDL